MAEDSTRNGRGIAHSCLRLTSVLLLAATLPLSGCLFRTRKVEPHLTNAALRTATQQELLDYVNSEAHKIQSLQATVDIDASVGDEKNNKVTDYKEIRGYVLARRPAMLRMKGLLPLVRNTAFDMVSDGQQFKLWIPPKNKFVVGSNNVQSYRPDQRLENLRPQHIYDALLIPEIGADDIAVVESGIETVLDPKRHRIEQPTYDLAVIRKGQNGWFLSRKISFSRTDLRPHRQKVFDEQGNLVTDAHYQQYTDYGTILFPNSIEIEMPQEYYDIQLHIVKLDVNRPLTNEQFALEQPPGAEVIRLNNTNSGVTKGGNNHSTN